MPKRDVLHSFTDLGEYEVILKDVRVEDFQSNAR